MLASFDLHSSQTEKERPCETGPLFLTENSCLKENKNPNYCVPVQSNWMDGKCASPQPGAFVDGMEGCMEKVVFLRAIVQ